MTDHYTPTLTQEEYKEEFFSDKTPSKTYVAAFSQELQGYVANGIGADERSAREGLVENIDNLINFLYKKRVEIMYQVKELEYTELKGD